MGLRLGALGQEICHVVAPPDPCLNDTHRGGVWGLSTLRNPRKRQPMPVFLPGESQDGGGPGELAVHGVVQSRTRLKRLSSSSSSRQGNHRLPRCLNSKESMCRCRRCRRCGFDPWVGKIPLEEKMANPLPIFLSGGPHKQRSLAGYSP